MADPYRSPADEAERPNEAEPVSEDPSPAQRLRIHIPSVNTTLSLGAAGRTGDLRSDDLGDPNFAGFGVSTRGHVFIDANGGVDKSSAQIQADGPVVLQSDQSCISLSAAGHSMMHAQGSAVVAGDAGLLLIAGVPHTKSVNRRSDGENPQGSEWTGDLPQAVTQVSNTWTTVSVAAGVIDMAVTGARTVLDLRNKVASFGSVARDLAQAGLSGWGNGVFAWAGSGFKLPQSKSALVYGDEGVTIGTASSTNIYSVIGTLIASATVVSTSAPWVGLTSGLHLDLFSAREASLGAGTNLDIKGGSKVTLASVKASLEMLAKEINIGETVVKGTQAPTQAIQLTAKSIQLTASESIAAEAKTIEAKAEDQASLRSGQFGCDITPSGVHIGSVADGADKKPADRQGPGLFADGNEARVGVNGWGVRIKKGQAAMGDMKSFVVASPGTVKLDSDVVQVKAKRIIRLL